MRITHFWELMAEEFGTTRAGSLARDHVFADLDGRTIEQALEAGVEPKEIWHVVCQEFDIPRERR